jgi:hypothetical protein
MSSVRPGIETKNDKKINRNENGWKGNIFACGK